MLKQPGGSGFVTRERLKRLRLWVAVTRGLLPTSTSRTRKRLLRAVLFLAALIGLLDPTERG